MVNEKMNYNVKISKLASNSFFMKRKQKTTRRGLCRVGWSVVKSIIQQFFPEGDPRIHLHALRTSYGQLRSRQDRGCKRQP